MHRKALHNNCESTRVNSKRRLFDHIASAVGRNAKMCHTRFEFGDHVNDENYTMAECNGMSKIICFW